MLNNDRKINQNTVYKSFFVANVLLLYFNCTYSELDLHSNNDISEDINCESSENISIINECKEKINEKDKDVVRRDFEKPKGVENDDVDDKDDMINYDIHAEDYYEEYGSPSEVESLKEIEELENEITENTTDARHCNTTDDCYKIYRDATLECVVPTTTSNGRNLKTSFGICKRQGCKRRNDNCYHGELCIKNNCVPVSEPSDRKCSKNRNCVGDFRCYVRRNICIQKHCEDSSECPGDTVCQASTNDIDRDSQCVGEKCRSNSDCDSEMECIAGKCLVKEIHHRVRRPSLRGKGMNLKNGHESNYIKMLRRSTNIGRIRCKTHRDCIKRHEKKRLCVEVEADNVANSEPRIERQCLRLPCKVDKDCPGSTACNKDEVSGYCSAFKCRNSYDCMDSQICVEHKCVMPAKCNVDLDCKRTHLCQNSRCTAIKCNDTNECPLRSKCDEKQNYCRNMACKESNECENDEKCQHGICVVRSGGKCIHHLNCPKLEICTKKGICRKIPCKGDADCQKGKKGNSELMCHPENYCTAHEDAIFGFSEAKSAKKNQDLGLMVMPKIFKENLPVPLHILRKELDHEIEKEMTKLGLRNEKKKEHSKILEYLDRQKQLCRENPTRKSCSKAKKKIPPIKKKHPIEFKQIAKEREPSRSIQKLSKDEMHKFGSIANDSFYIQGISDKAQKPIKRSKRMAKGQELSSESFEPDFESTEKNSKEEDYSQLQTIEGDQSNDQESLSYLSNDDTNESIYEDRNKLSHSSIEEAFSRNSIHDTFSDESTFSALNSQEVLTLDQSSYQRSDNDAYSNEEKLSTEGEGKAHNTSSEESTFLSHESQMKRTFERSSYTEYEDESSVESNPDEYYDDEYHDNFERDVEWLQRTRIFRRIRARLRQTKSFVPSISLDDPAGTKFAAVDPNLIPLGDESEASLHAISSVQKRFRLKSNHIKGFSRLKKSAIKVRAKRQARDQGRRRRGRGSPRFRPKEKASCRWRGNNAAGLQHLNTVEFNAGCRLKGTDLDNVRLYRSHSGVCNRLQSGKEELGVLGLPFQRLLPADYHDGIQGIRRSTVNPNKLLPNPKKISNEITNAVVNKRQRRSEPNPEKQRVDDIVNQLFVFYGQFLDHDVSNSAPRTVSTSDLQASGNSGLARLQNGLGGGFCCGPDPAHNTTNQCPNWNCGNTMPREKMTPTERKESLRETCISFRFPPDDPEENTVPQTFRRRCHHQQSVIPSSNFDCFVRHRDQMSQISHWFDLSQVYNSKKASFDFLSRNKTNPSKVLAGTANPDGPNHPMMPRCPIDSTVRSLIKVAPNCTTSSNAATCLRNIIPNACIACIVPAAQRRPNRIVSGTSPIAPPSRAPGQRDGCFIGGDFRTNENIPMASLHTQWYREHNRVRDILKSHNPNWSEENLFQETRRIVIAEYQHIIYNEFLPPLLGRKLMQKFRLRPRNRGYSNNFDPKQDPRVPNVFAAASFRFGHTMIPEEVVAYNADGTIPNGNGINSDGFRLDINDVQLRFDLLKKQNYMTKLIRGLMYGRPARVDAYFAKTTRRNTDNFWHGGANNRPNDTIDNFQNGFDLYAWNINRGRDHGSAPYYKWLKHTREASQDINEKVKQGYRYLKTIWHEGVAVTNALKRTYDSYKDIDIYVGGLAERPPLMPGRRSLRRQRTASVLGTTHAWIIADTFAKLKRADRFFYEEGGWERNRFAPQELNEIKKFTMAHLLCFNLKSDTEPTPMKVLEHPFLQPRQRAIDIRRPRNLWIDCKQYTEQQRPINYRVFKGIFKGGPRQNQKVGYNRNLGRPRFFRTLDVRGGNCVNRCVESGRKPKRCATRCRCISGCKNRGKSILLCKKRCQTRKTTLK